MKKKKNVTAVSFDDLKQIVLNDAKKEDGEMCIRDRFYQFHNTSFKK